MEMSRVTTGVCGIDEITNGGFFSGSSYLVVGGPGTGKTILSVQFLRESAGRKARCLLISLNEPIESIARNVSSFGWTLDGIRTVDLSKAMSETRTDGEYSVFPPGEVEGEPVWRRIDRAIEEHRPEVLVIDSATNLRYLSTDEYQYRKHVQRLVNSLGERGCTSLLLFESSELNRETSLALIVDGVISLKNEISPGRVIEIRTLEIVKMRGSDYMSGRHPLRISSDGVTVYPHRIEKSEGQVYERCVLPSGVPELDHILMGGISSGTSTLITGPSGVGKTSLAAQFLVTAARSGRRGVFYTFEEGVGSIVERCRALGLPLDEAMEDGSIDVREVNPLELYPDEFLEVMRRDVEREGRSFVVLDSLRSYNLAMEQFGNIPANVQNILNYLKRNKASIILINEMEKLTGELRITELGVSYLSDNVLMIRYAECNGEVIKVISCLKMRHGDFLPELREFKITKDGIKVGDKLRHLRGVLTGVPVSELPERELPV